MILENSRSRTSRGVLLFYGRKFGTQPASSAKHCALSEGTFFTEAEKFMQPEVIEASGQADEVCPN